MRKTAVFALAAVIALAAAAPSFGQDVQKVLDKMIEAQGGRKAIQAAQDTTMTGTMELIPMGLTGSFTRYQKEPDKFRQDIEVMGMVITQAYDGKTAWMINPQTGAAEELPEAMAKSMVRESQGNDALLDPAKVGITYKLLPNETVNGVSYVVLQQVMKDGYASTLLLDPKTYLPAITRGKSMNQAGAEVDSETTLSDYRKVGDLMVPHQISVKQEGTDYVRLAISKVTYNTGLQDSFFQMSK